MSNAKAAIKPILPARVALPVILLALLLLNSLTTAQNDNCCHIDRHCNTDHEWINGYWAYQNNQCGASQQQGTPTSAPSQSQGGTSSQTDNCCHVDRQCNADHEWINGYWAYQNNQCGASQQQGTPTSSPSQAQRGTSSHVDNCCFVDRLCESDEQWTSGYWAYQNNQCPGAQNSQSQSRALGPASEEINNCCFIGWQCSADEEWQGGYWAFQYDQCDSVQSQWQANWRQRQSASSRQTIRSGYDDIKVDGVIVRRPTQQEFCEALKRLELPLPPECEDN